MALQVWLPLNGNLNNQGLSGADVTQTGTIDLTNDGKIGKCATFTTARGYLNLPASVMTSFSECSVAFWVNITAWNTGYDTFFQAGLSGSGWNKYIFGVLRNNNNRIVCALTNSSNLYSGSMYSSSDLTIGAWVHLVFIYKDNKIKIYINGDLDKEYNGSLVPNFAGITYVTIGAANDSRYQTNCKMNDFRIYDHALSPMEVKQLSQALVLHYPLNNNGAGGRNLYVVSSSAEGYIVSGTGTYLGAMNATWKEHTSDYISVSAGEQYVFQAWATATTGDNQCWMAYAFYDSNKAKTGSSGNRVAKYFGTKDEYSYGVYSFTIPSGAAYLRVSSSMFSDGKVKVERGSKATPWSPAPEDGGFDNSIVYDCSGYGNNGATTGSVLFDSDTPKYNVSQVFDNNQLIESEALPSETQTIACWIKWTTLPTNGYTIPIFDRKTGLAIGMSHNARLITYIGNTSGGAGSQVFISFTTNTWYHIAVVKTGDATRATYINGELKPSSGANYWAGDLDKFLIGGRHSAGVYKDYFSGQLCDVRAYATALSADDILRLYQNSAYVDNAGNTYAAEYVEG